MNENDQAAYDKMTPKQKARYEKWTKRGENMNTVGTGMMGIGCATAIIGVFLTIIVAVLFLFIF